MVFHWDTFLLVGLPLTEERDLNSRHLGGLGVRGHGVHAFPQAVRLAHLRTKQL